MKQGTGHTFRSGGKVEPSSKAVSPGGADQIGQKLHQKADRTELYPGRGYSAPMAGKMNHGNCGSQGRH